MFWDDDDDDDDGDDDDESVLSPLRHPGYCTRNSIQSTVPRTQQHSASVAHQDLRAPTAHAALIYDRVYSQNGTLNSVARLAHVSGTAPTHDRSGYRISFLCPQTQQPTVVVPRASRSAVAEIAERQN